MSPIWRSEDNTYLITPFDFTIYLFKNGEMNPHCYIDFGAFGLDSGELANYDFNYSDFVDEKSRIVALDNLINTNRFLAFSFFWEHELRFIIYSKENKEIYYSDVLFNKGIIPKCRLFTYDDGRFIGDVNPKDYLEFIKNYHYNHEELIKPSEFDNPYIITFEIVEN
jgi:hypothetical protein